MYAPGNFFSFFFFVSCFITEWEMVVGELGDGWLVTFLGLGLIAIL